MAYGIAEDPGRSLGAHLDAVDYPVWREQLVKTAEDNDASRDVINLLKSLPRGRYESKPDVWRDLAEAARRFALGLDDEDPLRDRRDIGRDHGP
jgi:hypothetical protein